MNLSVKRAPDPKWKLYLRLAGLAAGLWALIELVIRHS